MTAQQKSPEPEANAATLKDVTGTIRSYARGKRDSLIHTVSDPENRANVAGTFAIGAVTVVNPPVGAALGAYAIARKVMPKSEEPKPEV